MGRDLRAIPAVKNRLPELRAEHGWSQEDLAARLGVSRKTVNVVETGRYDPSLTLAFTIARMFAQPIERIRGGEHSVSLGDTPRDERDPTLSYVTDIGQRWYWP